MKRIVFSLLCVCVLLCDLHAQKAQAPFRRLSYSQFLAEMQNCPDSVYTLKNAIVYYDPKTDSSTRFLDLRRTLTNIARIERNLKAKKVTIPPDEPPIIEINKDIFLTDVFFEDKTPDLLFKIYGEGGFITPLPISIRRVHFKKEFSIYLFKKKVDSPDDHGNFDFERFKVSINFQHCIFERLLYVGEDSEKKENKYLEGNWRLYNCRLKYGYTFSYSSEKAHNLEIKESILCENGGRCSSHCNFSISISSSTIYGVFAPVYLPNRDAKENNLNFTIKNCHFKANRKTSNLGFSVFSYSKAKLQKIVIDSCIVEKIPDSLLAKMPKKDKKPWNEAGIQDITCEQLVITNSRFDTHFYIVGSKITEEIFFENNQFNSDFSLGSGSAQSGFDRNIFNFQNAYMPYKQFKKNLSTEIGGKQTTVYYGIGDKELANEVEYEHLLRYYNAFYKMYQDQKDQASANACYVALKKLETRKLAYEYRKKPNIKNYLNWQLNEFLDYFSDFGTDPVRSLEKSLYWILVFTALFSVFPSEKDYLQKSELMPVLSRWGAYLKREGGFSEVEAEKRAEKLKNLENFRQELMLSYGKIPTVLAVFANPLYRSALWYYQLNKWFVEKIDFTQGNWAELSKRRKFWVSVSIFVAIVVLLAWGVVMRLVNALALSLNCFVTLGYGEIQAKGIARYLAVVEGLFGWFMLSIFSVSLIGQLLG